MKRDQIVRWTDELRFIGTSRTGHDLNIDSKGETGPTPMELMLLGTGGCAAIDLVMILKKARQQVSEAWVEVGGIRRDEMPKIYTNIEMHFVVKGRDVKEKHVERAIRLAMETYCSASAHMAALAKIETSYEIIEE